MTIKSRRIGRKAKLRVCRKRRSTHWSTETFSVLYQNRLSVSVNFLSIGLSPGGINITTILYFHDRQRATTTSPRVFFQSTVIDSRLGSKMKSVLKCWLDIQPYLIARSRASYDSCAGWSPCCPCVSGIASKGISFPGTKGVSKIMVCRVCDFIVHLILLWFTSEWDFRAFISMMLQGFRILDE